MKLLFSFSYIYKNYSGYSIAQDNLYLRLYFHSARNSWSLIIPVGIYMFKVNNRNARTRCQICSKLTIKTSERRHWRRFGVFTVKACVRYFFIKFLVFHQLIAPQKLWKVFFISTKKHFSFSRYSNFCNFFSSFPHFTDAEVQMEVE